ncbi:MAG: hypothetical protein DMG21_13605 [Acidobacteria bacterium]|nr:MAG: hypothetical protein DMG21_13605 [Acidobacteriota bacterium]
MTKKQAIMKVVSTLILSGVAVGFAGQRAGEKSVPSAGEEFYIVSTVDLGKKQMVLKRPTEVTVLMQVTDKTVFKNLEAKSMQLKDLRAGDTVFVRAVPDAEGRLVASSVRIGIMTERELYERYLKGIPISPQKS